MSVASSCPTCGEGLGEGAASCTHCGTPLLACPTCGGPLLTTDRFCARCGTSREGERPAPEDYSSSIWEEVLGRLREATAGEFEVLREIGRGGMAAVFLARDLQLTRPVAIKVMAPGLLTGMGMVERFRQEAKTVANLNHPNIITIHTVRQTAGLHYFVMKLIAGRSLEKIIESAKGLPLPVIQAVLFQVGSALSYAHRRGVIHRDVKPANILMDEDGHAVVTDFGIAKVVESIGHTQTGAAIGTPPYMSPEQCWSRDVTGASDQYSLGIVAYELLTGKPPFSGPTLAVMRAHTEDPPPPIRAARPDCPADVEAAVMRMLEKEPGHRWPSATEAVGALGGRPLAEGDPARDLLAQLAHRPPGDDQLRDAGTPRSPIPRRTSAPPRPATPEAPTILPPSAIVVRAPTGVTQVGESMRVEAGPKAADGRDLPPYPVTWSSSDPAVAAVSPSGLVQALRPGAVTITATTAEGVSGNVALRIASLPVASVTVSAPRGRLSPGEAIGLSVELRDTRGERMSDGSVTWSSSDPAIARISASGQLSALGVGTVTITAASETGVRGSLLVAVVPAAAGRVEIAPLERPPYAGERVRLTAVVRDARGEVLGGRGVEWSSSRGRVARVESGGVLSALEPGETEVTARCEGQTASVKVRVLAVPVSGLTISGAGSPLTMGRKLRLEATCLDRQGAPLGGREVRWSSSDPAVATVDQHGVVRGRSDGSATIRAECEGVGARVSIMVAPAPLQEPFRLPAWSWMVPAVALAGLAGWWGWTRDRGGTGASPTVGAVAVEPAESSGTATILVTGATGAIARLELSAPPATVTSRDTFRLTATPRDSSGAAAPGDVGWRSSQTSVAKVSAGGLVTAVGAGQVTITATSGAQTASVKITVEDRPVARLNILPPSVTLRFSDSVHFRAEVLGADGNPVSGTVLWQADPGVATISPDGVARAAGPGSTTVTATSGGIRGTATLTVVPEATGTAVATIVLSGMPSSLQVGDRAQVGAVPQGAQDQPLTDRPVTWTSGDTRIATVDGRGVVMGISPGRAQITATSGGQSASATLAVVARDTVAAGGGAGPASSVGAFVAVGAGGGATCAVREGGELFCWGNGTLAPAAMGNQPLRGISLGIAFGCGVAGSEKAYCWGDNGKGQLGNGSSRDARVPALVSEDISFKEVSAGNLHACGLSPGGNVFCWGDNSGGQLGDGSKDRRVRPTQIRGNQRWRQVASGGMHSCGLTADGQAFCWGDGFSGALGQGMLQNELEPVPVTGGLHFSRLTAGRRHSCGLTPTGEAYCWGDNRDGQLGDGSKEDSAKPVEVAGEVIFRDLSAGAGHTCGVSAAGQIYCWGNNQSGQLGVGGTEPRRTPGAVRSAEVFVQVSAGTAHTCAVTRARAVLCWGLNSRGQLGDGTQSPRPAPGEVLQR